MTFGIIVIVWLLAGILGYLIGNTKGRAQQGAILGLLLSVLGVIIVAVLPPAGPAASGPGPAKAGGKDAGYYEDIHVERNLPQAR